MERHASSDSNAAVADPLVRAALVERQKYNRNARFYNLTELPMEWLFYRRWRRRLFSLVKGPRILEVGVGTGKNLPFYPGGLWAVGVDLSEKMMSKARSSAKAKGVYLCQADAQHLAFRDAVFDSVVATFVFCSVPDPIVGMKEIRRVLKPEGQLLLLEHVRPQNRALAAIFDAADPLVFAASGVHINRTTADNLRKAGFRIVREENLLSTVYKLFVVEKAEGVAQAPEEAEGTWHSKRDVPTPAPHATGKTKGEKQ